MFRGAGTGNDRVYVGNNDFNAAVAVAPPRSTSRSTEPPQPPPPPSNFVARRIEPRATNGQDLPPIRPAVHIDGTVYAAYFGRRAGGLSDVVVARDDDWAAGATQFAALLDSGDGLAGQRVVTGRNIPFENFGTMALERLVASDLSIAVDPRDSRRVWVAWGDRPAEHRASRCTCAGRPTAARPGPADLRTVGEREGAGARRQQPRPGRVPLPAADGRRCRTSAG